jgi:hypothetical protein
VLDGGFAVPLRVKPVKGTHCGQCAFHPEPIMHRDKVDVVPRGVPLENERLIHCGRLLETMKSAVHSEMTSQAHFRPLLATADDAVIESAVAQIELILSINLLTKKAL